MLVMMTVSSTGNTAELSDVTIHSESTYLSFYIVIDKKKGTLFSFSIQNSHRCR